MGRKKKGGQKGTDSQAGGDAAVNPPGPSGISASAPGQSAGPPGGPKKPQDQKHGDTQQGGQGRGKQRQQQQKTPHEMPPQQQPQGASQQQEPPQGAWQTKGQKQPQQQLSPQTRGQQQAHQIPGQQQPQGPWQTRGQQQTQQQRLPQEMPAQQQPQGQWQVRGQQQPHQIPAQQQQQGPWQTRGQQQTQQQRLPQEMPAQQHPQGQWPTSGQQQQYQIPAQQQPQNPWQARGQQQTQQQRLPQEMPAQQQPQGQWQARGQQQPHQMPAQQQPQGPWQARGQQQTQQQRLPQEMPAQQQPQGQWQARGHQQPHQMPAQQQPQGQWPARGQQQGSQQMQGSSQGMPVQQQPQKPRGQQQQSKGQHPGTPQHRMPSQQQGQGAISRPQSSAQIPTQEISKLSMDLVPGTQGRRIQVETNHISIDFGKLKTAYHYDVQINPDRPKSMQREVFEQFRKMHFPKNFPAFDGRKNMYSPRELFPSDKVLTAEIELKVPNETKTKTFKVEVKFATEVDLTPLHNMRITSSQQALQCVEIVLRNPPAMRCIQAGRSFYTRPPQIVNLGEGMEMYYGFYQTVIRGWKPFFNIDVAHKAFPMPKRVIDVIAEIGSDYRRTLTPDDLKHNQLFRDVEAKVEKHLKRLRVVYEIPGMKREYTVNGLDQPPSIKKFTVDNKTMTIEDYFQTKYNLRLNFPLMPTLWVGSLQRKDKILLPAEFCTVVANQVVNRKMTENQTSEMIKRAATSTEVRKQKIMNSLREARHNEDACVKEFGFRLNSSFEKVEARVLNPPALEYGNAAVCRVSKGVWRQDMNKFYRGAEAASWIIISVCGNMQRECTVLAKMISDQAAKCGMRLAARPGSYDCVDKRQATPREVHGILQKYSSYNLIFVIIPDSGPTYASVKKAAELNLNCLTQCIKRRTMMKMNQSTVGNILLKVNSKLSGTNHCLKTRPLILNEPCMIMGADVTHPSPDSQNIPSVVAVTASHDPKAMFGYNMTCRLQLPTVEIIEDLEEITREHLLYFYKQNRGQKPYRIIFFRDGVSEGQFDEVKKKELMAIRRACSKLEQGYEPKVTFIVVQKRHHTRFFPDRKDSDDRNINVPAGTCVDTVITSPNQQDFYLVSHASIQGVAKPTKYSTLWDENNMSYDDVEQLAYYLCHLFSRCNRSVSYPAPTYYAHLGAARAKVYIESESINFENLRNEQRKLKNDIIRKENPMFFV